MEGQAPIMFRHPFSEHPSDQCPPCPTLIIHNPPVQSANDAFMSLIQSQTGFKRSKFFHGRTGIVCLIEFETKANAGGALYALYGHRPGGHPGTELRVGFSTRPFEIRPTQVDSQVLPNTAQVKPSPTDAPLALPNAPAWMTIHQEHSRNPFARAGRPNHVLFLVNLPDSFSEDAIIAVFSKQPGIDNIEFVQKRNFRPFKQMCFVSFINIASASRAIEQLNGFTLPGIRQRVYLKYADLSDRPGHERSQRPSQVTSASQSTYESKVQATTVVPPPPTSKPLESLCSGPVGMPSNSTAAVQAIHTHVEAGHGDFADPVASSPSTQQMPDWEADTCRESTLNGDARPPHSQSPSAIESSGAGDHFPIEASEESPAGPPHENDADWNREPKVTSTDMLSQSQTLQHDSNLSEGCGTTRITDPPHFEHSNVEQELTDRPKYNGLDDSTHVKVDNAHFDVATDEKRTLFIGSLPSAITAAELQSAYEHQPGVKEVRFTRPNGKPICFVEFQDTASALQAIKTTRRLRFHDHFIKPRIADREFGQRRDSLSMFGHPCNTVFVSNLPEAIRPCELEPLFATQPGFLDLSVLRHPDKSHCFVLFCNDADAGDAIQRLNGYRMQGTKYGKLRLEFAQKPFRPTTPHPGDYLDVGEDDESDDDWGSPAAASVHSDDSDSEYFSDVDTDEPAVQKATTTENNKHAVCTTSRDVETAKADDIVDASRTKSLGNTTAAQQQSQTPDIDIAKGSASPMPSSKAFRSPQAVTQNNDWLAKSFISSSGNARIRDTRSTSSPALLSPECKVESVADMDTDEHKFINEVAEVSVCDSQIPRLPDPKLPLRMHQKGLLELLQPGATATPSVADVSSVSAEYSESNISARETPSASSQADMLELMPFYDRPVTDVDPSNGHELTESTLVVAETAAAQCSKRSANFLDLPLEIRHHIYDLLFDSVFALVSKIGLFREFVNGRLPCSSALSNGISPDMFPCLKEDSSPPAVSKLAYGRRPGLPSEFFGRRMICKNLPFQKNHSTKGLSRPSVNTGLLLACRRVSAEFSEFAHHRLALAFGSQKSMTQWLMMLDSAGVKKSVGSWKGGTPFASFSRMTPAPIIMNTKAHIRNLCLEIKHVGEPEDAAMRKMRFKYYENWRRACAMVTQELTSLRQLAVSAYVPDTRESQSSQLNLGACWVSPLLEFGKSGSLSGVSVTLVLCSNASSYNVNTCTNDTLTAFSEVLRRKMLGGTDEAALMALREARAGSHETKEEVWDAVEASNGMHT